MKLSIIIVNYKTGPLTKMLVESLLSDVDLPQHTEIVVVDNASGGEEVAFLRSDFPNIRVLENNRNLGLAKAVNRGIAESRGEYVLNLNPDMVAMPGSVKTLVHFMDAHADVGMAGGLLLSPNGAMQPSCFRFYRPLTIVYRRTRLGRSARGQKELDRFLMKDFDRQTVKDVEWLQGACLIVRRSALQEVGGMDERYFLYFEDVDWCRRFWEKGYRVTFVPQAKFSHFHQRSSERGFFSILTNRPTREHIKSAIKYFIKFRGKDVPKVGA